MTAAHVGDPSTRGQLLDHTVEGRQPGGDQVDGVAGSEEALDALEEIGMLFVPTESCAGGERLGDGRHGAYNRRHRQERTPGCTPGCPVEPT